MSKEREALKLALEALEDYKYAEARTIIREALAQPEQEPVALETVYETIIQWDEGGGKRSRRELARRIVSLYTTPPQRKPLTDEDVNKLVDDEDWYNDPHGFVRAIEAAHGIKGEA